MILHQEKKDCLNVSILCASQVKLLTSNGDSIAAINARFQYVNQEIMCDIFQEKRENNDIGKSDTFGCWFCDFLF